MKLKKLIKKLTTKFSSRKKIIVLWAIGIVWILSLVFVVKAGVDMSASIMQLLKKPIVKQLSTCNDTDGGSNYTTQGTITVVENGNTRIEMDSCNPDGTLREWFCGNPWDAASLLRSENFVPCAYWCDNWSCIDGLNTWTIIRDVAIEEGTFIASSSHEATFNVTVKNIGNIVMPIDGIGNTLYLDIGANPLSMSNYSLQINTPPSVSALQPNDTYTISVTIILQNNLTFTYNSNLHIDISTYPEVDSNMSNNIDILYITGQIVDCNTPENILACSLWLASCPAECTWQTTTPNCLDPNIQYACADCNTPENIFSCLLGLSTCPAACMWAVTNTWLACPSQCDSCSDSDGWFNYFVQWITKWLFITNHLYEENQDYCIQNTQWLVENYCGNEYSDLVVIECGNGCSNGACNQGWTGYGYGYGYGRGGQGTGYGYGYGYVKIDSQTKEPYIYLIDVFKSYSEKIYKKVIKKIWFKIVKFFNEKEFKISKPSTR